MTTIRCSKRDRKPKVKKHNRRCACGKLCWPNYFRCSECFDYINNFQHDAIYEAEADYSHALEVRFA